MTRLAWLPALLPLLRARASLQVYGTDRLAALGTPAVVAANSTSRLDIAAVLAALPRALRQPMGRTVVSPRIGASLAFAHQVPVVPVGIRGSAAATPRGRSVIRRRPRVAVRFGQPIRPLPGQSPRELTAAVEDAVGRLVAEDANTWWQVQRGLAPAPEPPASRWRQVWEATAEPLEGGQPRPAPIWRS